MEYAINGMSIMPDSEFFSKHPVFTPQFMNLLFVCTHNACRSILAETITRSLAEGRFQVASAGSQPAGTIHPLTIEFLESNGYRTDGLRSKGFDDLGNFKPDVVITVCDSAANESCPVWLSNDATSAHWGLPDPSHMEGTDAERTAAFRSVAEILKSRIAALLNEPVETMDGVSLVRLLNSLKDR
jgi:arsenate reductase